MVSTPEKVALKLGDFNLSNIIRDFHELVEVPEIKELSRAEELLSPDPCHTLSADPIPSSTPPLP